MNIQNLSWELFSKTGSVDAYLGYKNVLTEDSKKEVTDGKQHNYEGNSTQTK